MQSVDGDVRLSVVLDDKSVTAQAAKLSSAIKSAFGVKADTKGIETSFNNVSQKVQAVTSNVGKINDSKFLQLKNKVEETANALELARKKQEEYSQSAKKTGDSGKELQKAIEWRKATLSELKATQAEFQKYGETPNWDINKAIKEQSQELDILIRKQRELEAGATSYDTTSAKAQQYANAVEKAGNAHEVAKAKLNEYATGANKTATQAQSSFSKVTNAIIKVSSAANNVSGKIYGGFKTAFGKVVSVAKSALSKVRSHFSSTRKSSKGMFDDIGSGVKRGLKMLLRYGLGVRGLFVLFRKLRTAAKEGFKNLGGYSDSFNQQVSNLLSASLRLKNAFAAAFQPLASAVLPIVTKIVNGISDALTKLGELLAALTGQKYYYKAVNTTAKYVEKKTKSTVKKVQKYLSPLDDINLFNDKDTGGDTGDTDNAADPSKMFETKSVSDKFKDLADKIKSLFKSKDWTELGTILGEAVNKGLRMIPWDKIDTTLQDTAKRIFTLLNGFIGAVDWALVGDTIAKGIRVALRFLYSLITGFNWAQLGKAIGTLINNALSAYNAALLAKTLSQLVIGILNTLVNIVNTVDWSKVSRNIIAFISNIDFSGISRWATRLLSGFAGAIEKTDFSGIGNAFRKGLSRINWQNIWNNLSRIFTSLLKGLTDFFGLKGVTTTPLKQALQGLYSPVQETWKALKQMLGAIIRPLINKLLPALVKGIGAILEGVTPIINALTPFVEFFIGFISKIVNSLAPVIKTIGILIGNILKTAAPYWETLGNIINAIVNVLAPILNVIFSVLGKIFGVVAQISQEFFGIINSWFEAQEGTSVSESIQKELDNLSNASEDLATVKENMESTIKSVDDSIKSTSDDIGYIDTLQQRMNELLNKSTLTPEEMQELNTIADLIGEKLPKFKDVWNQMTKVDKNGNLQFTQSRDTVIAKINETIEALKRQYATEALKEEFKQAYKEQVENNKKIAEATNKVTSAENALADAQTKNWQAFQQIQKLRKAGYDNNSKEIQEQQQILNQTSADIPKLQSKIEGYKKEVLAASGEQGKVNAKLKELSGIIQAVSGDYKTNKYNLQGLRDAYEAGFIDTETLKNEFKLTADELYKGTKTGGERATEGMKAGVDKGVKNLEDAGTEVATKTINATYKKLKLGSPSREYKQFGKWSVVGFTLGMQEEMAALYSYVVTAFTGVVERTENALKPFTTIFNIIPTGAKLALKSTKTIIKNAINVILGYFQTFFNVTISGLNTLLADLSKVNKSIPNKAKISNIAYERLSQIKIPKLATGAVIPPNKEFMAVLGDQKHGNNIEAPESLLRRIMREERGGNNTYTVNAQVGAKTLFSIILDEAKLQQVQTGHSPFEMIKGV